MSDKKGAVTISRDGFYTETTLSAIGQWIMALDQTLGGETAMTYRLKAALGMILNREGKALVSCPCFEMQVSDYPLICADHSNEVNGATPAMYITVHNCENPAHPVHYVPVAYGVGFPKNGAFTTQQSAEDFLDTITCESDVKSMIEGHLEDKEFSIPKGQLPQ